MSVDRCRSRILRTARPTVLFASRYERRWAVVVLFRRPLLIVYWVRNGVFPTEYLLICPKNPPETDYVVSNGSWSTSPKPTIQRFHGGPDPSSREAVGSFRTHRRLTRPYDPSDVLLRIVSRAVPSERRGSPYSSLDRSFCSRSGHVMGATGR